MVARLRAKIFHIRFAAYQLAPTGRSVPEYSTELKELPPGEKARTTFFYHRTLDNIRNDPNPFLS